MTVYCGRDFSTTELARIVLLIADNPQFHRADLSREVCRMLQWYKADGGLKEISCRVAMLRMHADCLIELILPWVQVKNPASKILAMAVKQLPNDRQNQYQITPVLMETFVETDRFAGTCYNPAITALPEHTPAVSCCTALIDWRISSSYRKYTY